MKPFLIFLLVTTALFSCSDDDDAPICGVDSPAEELAWLRTEIEQRERSGSDDVKYCYITEARLDGQTVIIYRDCNPLVNKVDPVFDCQGNSLGFLGSDISVEDLDEFCVIWRPADFVCLIDFVCIREN